MWRPLGDRSRPGAAPHDVLAAAAPGAALADLVANLGVSTGAVCVALLAGTVARVAWPSGPPPGAATLAAPVPDGPNRRLVLAVWLPPGGVVTAEDGAVLRATAGCVAVVLHGRWLHEQLRGTAAEAERADAELHGTTGRLELVREAERRRLVAAIVAATSTQLAGLRATVGALTGADPPGALARLRTGLDELITRFRTVVRGVHPTVLREHGPLTALEELAGDLPRPVRFAGTPPRRTGWEVESGFYHAVAAVLEVFAATGASHPLRVTTADRDGLLDAVVLDEPAGLVWIGRVRDVLALDADRIAALGGALTPELTRDGIAVRVTLPDRFDRSPAAAAEPVGPAATGPRSRLRALAVDGARADPPRAAAWSAIADRLDEPPRVAVLGTGADALLDALVGAEVRAALPPGVPVWLTAGPLPLVTRWPRGGGRPDRAPLAMARLPATEAERARVDRLVVQWPAPVLRDLTLIDPADSTTEVDAVLYVLPADGTVDPAVAAVRGGALLVGVASTDAAAQAAADRCDLVVRADPALALLGATLRADEFQALRADDRTAPTRLPDRLRAAAAALAGSADDVSALRALFAERGGLPALHAVLAEHLARDGDLVVARQALRAMTVLTRFGGPVELAVAVERLTMTAAELVEFDVLEAVRRGTLALPDPDAAARLLGGHGRDPRTRLGLPATATDAELGAATDAAARTWRGHAAHLGAATGERDACLVLAALAERMR